jgi:hypothetical protein
VVAAIRNDPPGLIGLEAFDGPSVFLRLDEELAVRPVDAVGSLTDLVVPATLAEPAVVEGVTGRARTFDPTLVTGYVATDRESGATLHQRDVTVQAILRWDVGAQLAAAVPGTLYARGKGGSAAEYASAILELRADGGGLGTVAWGWQDIAGTLHLQDGAQWPVIADDWILLTATRRWVSTGEVVLRYFINGDLAAEVTSADGSIGGGTTGTTQVGARWTGAAWANHLAGDVDQLRVYDRELTPEEVSLTWRRITQWQPLGYQLVRRNHPPGFPISDDRYSRVQKETRLWGHALGFAGAAAEDLRENTLPDRAYGATLEQWEGIVKGIPPKQGDSVGQRRKRVVARLRESKGSAIEGVKDALEELVDLADVDDLEFLAFDQTTVDDFATDRNDARWLYRPTGTWASDAGALRAYLLGAWSLHFDGATRDWWTAMQPIGGNGREAHILAAMTVATLAAGGTSSSEAGVFFGNEAHGDFVLLGLRHDATSGDYQIVTERFVGWVSGGLVVRATLALAPLWLHLRRDSDTTFAIAWSTTAAAGPYTEIAGIATDAPVAHGYQWAGLYVRTTGPGSLAVDVSFDGVRVRAPYGNRPYHFYVYRDPALPGTLDAEAANTVLRELKQGFTAAAVVSTKAALYDDVHSTYDSAPLGGV